jgi:uncharacterized protein YbjT (DUF2867 family)
VRAVVFGASGVIGRALLPALAERGEVVAISRHRQEAVNGVTWASADATDPTAVDGVLRQGDVVVYLVHSLGADDFEETDRLAADTVAAAAARAGVRQIVYLGGLGATTDADSPHLRSRAETGERLAAGRVPVTTLRAGMVVGTRSAAFETIRALVDRLPAMICPRWVSTPTQPIAIDDAVAYLAAVCGREECLGQSYDIGGPEVMTYREMIERIAAVRGRRPLIVEVPVLTPRLSSYWLHLVTPVSADVARPLIEGLRNPTIVHDDRIRQLFPIDLTPFDTAVEKTLSRRRAAA